MEIYFRRDSYGKCPWLCEAASTEVNSCLINVVGVDAVLIRDAG